MRARACVCTHVCTLHSKETLRPRTAILAGRTQFGLVGRRGKGIPGEAVCLGKSCSSGKHVARLPRSTERRRCTWDQVCAEGESRGLCEQCQKFELYPKERGGGPWRILSERVALDLGLETSTLLLSRDNPQFRSELKWSFDFMGSLRSRTNLGNTVKYLELGIFSGNTGWAWKIPFSEWLNS